MAVNLLFAVLSGPLFRGLQAVRDGTRAATIRCRESLVLSSYEEVTVFTRTFEKPALGSGVRFDSAVMQNMSHRDTARSQRAGNQEAAMAVKRIALRTHPAQPGRPPRGVQPIEANLEARPLRHRLVIGDAIAIERRIARPAA